MPKFVVQKHKARNLHYDFRLEIGDVLKSWAVPKGPSLNPADKRLAVEVEDHAISYMFFEGKIPEGEYGAGEVIVWDRGDYSFEEANPIEEQYKNGIIKIKLKGEKLNGGFNIVRMKWDDSKPKWLLIKEYDEHVSNEDILKEKPGSVISLRTI
jgi:bifunctional non-homologous end joining protein LigD